MNAELDQVRESPWGIPLVYLKRDQYSVPSEHVETKCDHIWENQPVSKNFKPIRRFIFE